MKRLRAFIAGFLTLTSAHAVGPVIKYVQISSGPVQSGGFSTQTGNVQTQMNLPYITGTQCVRSTNGVLSGTGADCGTGGGGGVSGGGSITASPQFRIPFYSVLGTSTAITGASGFSWYGSSVQVTGTTVSSGTVLVQSANSIGFNNTSNNATSQINNPGASNQSQMNILAGDGIGINNSANPAAADVVVYPGNAQTYGRFAVEGTSANLVGAYSGFTATSPISQSTLWALPVKDGTAGQALITDGSTHLSFSTISGGGSSGQVSLSTGVTGILPVANGGSGTASPGLIAGTNITSITGAWPNQTINASGGGGGTAGGGTINASQNGGVAVYSAAGSSTALTGSSILQVYGSSIVANQALYASTGSFSGVLNATNLTSTFTAVSLIFMGGNAISTITITSAGSGSLGYDRINDNSGNPIQIKDGSTVKDVFEGASSFQGSAASGWTINNRDNITADVGLSLSNTLGNAHYRFINFKSFDGSDVNGGNIFYKPSNLFFETDRSWVFESPVQSTFTYGVTASTLTVISTATVAALSMSGSGNLSFTNNGAGFSSQVVGSSAAVTVGNRSCFSSSWTIVDCGANTGGGGTPGGSAYQLQYSSNSAFAGAPGTSVTASSITLTNLTVAPTSYLTMLAPTPGSFYKQSLTDSLMSWEFFQNGVGDNTMSWSAANGMVINNFLTATGANKYIKAEGALISADPGTSVSQTAGGIAMLTSASGNPQAVAFAEHGVANRGVIGFAGGKGAMRFETQTDTIGSGTLGMMIDQLGPITEYSSTTVAGAGGFNTKYGAILGSATIANLTAGQCVQTGAGGLLTTTGSACSAGGGGGASTLAVSTGNAAGYTGVPTSSPTTVVNFDSSTFLTSLKGGSTAFVQLNPSSVTLQGLVTAASLGALTANQNITVSGDSTGSGTTAITLTAAARQANITTLTSSVTVTGAGGFNTTYGAAIGTGTFYSTTVSSTALVVMSTTGASAFAVNNSSVTAGDYMLAVSSANPGAIMMAVNTYGMIMSSGTTPTVGACGSSPAITAGSGDMVGSISWTGAATTCAVNFSHTFGVAPFCFAVTNGASFAEASTSTTAMSWTLNASLSGGTLQWLCMCGNKGC